MLRRARAVGFLALGMAIGGAQAVPAALGGGSQAETASLASGTTAVKGTLSLQTVTGPSCRSPVGLCYTGTIGGKLRGSVDGTASDVLSTVDTPTTSVVLVIGDVVLHLEEGDLLLKEARPLSTRDAGNTTAVWTVVGGSGGLAGANGEFRVSGVLSQSAGGESSYVGSLMLP